MLEQNIGDRANQNNSQEILEQQFEVEDEEELGEFDIPLKERKLVTHPYDFVIRTLKAQIDDNTLVLADKFQRRHVWDRTKSSRLIESLLLNVPIPVCYFAELNDGCYSVIDGQQRLTAIYRFLNNEFPLRALKVLPEINRKKFQDLDMGYQRLLLSRTIRCIVILKESHPDIKFDVFERLNSGFVPLNAQELRNSVFRGKLNDLILKLSEDEVFQKARRVSGIDKRMQDCEMILRFFAFFFDPIAYRGTLSRFLDSYLQSGINFDEETLEHHREVFRKTIDDVFYVFGDQAFRRYNPEVGWEKSINRAIYDVIMLTFASLESEAIRSKKEEIIEALKKVCIDPEFDEAITSSTKNKERIQTRINKWREALWQVGLEVPPLKIGK
ncbi:DUF262 domain-containing protein [Phormidium sp. CCY1219]|uniref:DUF262 domain-containing protein n=1 Tax=Phormidium sp. CCY1219 TaxID=2886104 RepID=UPI002D1F6CDA|nr:DUF262 domain-containing protein [Phormidium sp. CCY1219]MEB3828566.1 DUF262 domain-containing protein [Phormidium sp. CCY1219]